MNKSLVLALDTVPGTPADNAKDRTMARAAETWGGEYWKTGTGGTVWNGITFDPELNQIYLGTGNAGPYDHAIRSPGGGDTLFMASIVALNADNGHYLWHYQVDPREGWDYKATANMISATLPIDGEPRKVLMQAPTNGFFYVLDRATGKLLSAEKTGKVTWADRIDLKSGRPVERAHIRYETGESVMWPSFFGTHNWQPMSFNPEVGLVYIPCMQAGARYTKSGHPKAQEINFGGLTLALALVVYMSACFYCHGGNLHSVGVAPDLRESSVPLAIAGFRTVLKDGALMQNGMPRFDKLSDEEVQQTYMYIRRGAREALGKRKASKESDVGTQ